MKKTLVFVAVNFMVLSALLVSVELLGQVTYLLVHGKLLPLGNRTVNSRILELHPYLVGRLKSSVRVEKNNKTITTNDDHTRWTGAEKNDRDRIRIAVLGGSTAFGSGVTDEDSWPALLQAKLGKEYAVINYGVPGYSTAENIIQMALLVPEKRPHIVLFYEGWNDLRNYHEKALGPDYYSHGIGQYGNLDIPAVEPGNRFSNLKRIFATAWLIDSAKRRIARFNQRTQKLFDTPDPFVDRIFVRNMNTLKILAENMGSFAVFIPQVLNYEAYEGTGGSHPWTRQIRDEAMPELMDRLNARVSTLCSSDSQDCAVLGAVLEEEWHMDDFVDEGHFSKSGGLKFSEIVARFIRSRFERGTVDGGS